MVHENTEEINKYCVQVNLDDWDVAMKYQAYLWLKTVQCLAGNGKFWSICLITACIYHNHCIIRVLDYCPKGII